VTANARRSEAEDAGGHKRAARAGPRPHSARHNRPERRVGQSMPGLVLSDGDRSARPGFYEKQHLVRLAAVRTRPLHQEESPPLVEEQQLSHVPQPELVHIQPRRETRATVRKRVCVLDRPGEFQNKSAVFAGHFSVPCRACRHGEAPKVIIMTAATTHSRENQADLAAWHPGQRRPASDERLAGRWSGRWRTWMQQRGPSGRSRRR
jgi:hypothetical protein